MCSPTRTWHSEHRAPGIERPGTPNARPNHFLTAEDSRTDRHHRRAVVTANPRGSPGRSVAPRSGAGASDEPDLSPLTGRRAITVDLSRPPPAFSHDCASPGVPRETPRHRCSERRYGRRGDVTTARGRSILGGPHFAGRRIVAELWAAGPPRSDECRPGGGEQAPPHPSSCCPVKVN